MSLNIYTTGSNITTENASLMKGEITSLINDYTTWNCNNTGDLYIYQDILNNIAIPGFRLRFDGTFITIQTTRYFTGGFHTIDEFSYSDISPTEAEFDIKPIQLIVINNGDFWELRIPFQDGSDGTRYGIIRSVTLKSSLNNQSYYTYFASLDYAYHADQFYGDYVFKGDPLIEGISTDYCKVCNSEFYSTGSQSTDDNKIILFPTTLPYSPSNNLGVPTIGDQKIYRIIGKSQEEEILPYTEFIVNQQKFVSIGSDLAIPSI